MLLIDMTSDPDMPDKCNMSRVSVENMRCDMP